LEGLLIFEDDFWKKVSLRLPLPPHQSFGGRRRFGGETKFSAIELSLKLHSLPQFLKFRYIILRALRSPVVNQTVIGGWLFEF